MCVLFTSIGILCVLQEELSLTESNQQISDLISEKQRHCGTL